MRHPKLDNRFIVPNNPNEIYQIFGIQAVRFYMFREYMRLIEISGSYISPLHINLLVDYQTHMGFLTPIHALGAAKQGISSLSSAAFKDPVGVFQKATAMGKTDKISSISSCIMVGKRCMNGTGFSDVEFSSEGKLKAESRPKPVRKNMRPKPCGSKLVDEGDPISSLPDRPQTGKYNNAPQTIPKMSRPNYMSKFAKKTKPNRPNNQPATDVLPSGPLPGEDPYPSPPYQPTESFSPPSSPSYMPPQPYIPTSPTEPPPGSPSYRPVSPSYMPISPSDPPPGASPSYRPVSPSYMPISPSDPPRLESGGYKPSSFKSPTYGPDSPNAYKSPTYGPDSPNAYKPSPLTTSPNSDDDIPDAPEAGDEDRNLNNW